MPKGREHGKVGRPKVVYPVQEMEYLMTVPMVAALFQVTEQSVRSWIHDKKIKFFRVPPDDGDLETPPTKRRSTLYTTRAAVADWAEKYYDL